MKSQDVVSLDRFLYLIFAKFIVIFLQLIIAISSPWSEINLMLFVCQVVSFCVNILLMWHMTRELIPARPFLARGISAFAILLATVSFSIYENILNVPWGWDALSFWLRDAARPIQEAGALGFFAANMQPNTIVLHIAGLAGVGSLTQFDFLAVEHAVIFLSCIYAATQIGLGRTHITPTRQSLLFIFGLGLSPLFYIHGSNVGYAEIWLSLAICAAVLAFSATRVVWLGRTLSFLFAGLCLAIKDSGALYFFTFLIGALLVLATSNIRCRLLQLVGAAVLFFYLAVGITMTPAPDALVIFALPRLGGHQTLFLVWEIVHLDDVISVGRVLIEVLLVNGSFGILLLLTSISLWSSIQRLHDWSSNLVPVFVLVFFVAIVLLLKIPYFIQHGLPGQDTSVSRLFVPVLPVLLALCCREIVIQLTDKVR